MKFKVELSYKKLPSFLTTVEAGTKQEAVRLAARFGYQNGFPSTPSKSKATEIKE